MRVVRKAYSNWVSILLQYSLGRKPPKFVLRSGLTVRGDRFDWYHLAMLLDANWHAKRIDERCLELQNSDGFNFKCRYKEGYDLGHLFEIFIEKAYGSNFSGKVIFDIGMSNGDSGIYFAQMGAKKVIGLEPLPESFNLAVENVKSNHLEDVVYPLNLGLASRTEEADFRVSTTSPNADSLNPTASISSVVTFDSHIKIMTTTIDELMKKFNIKEVDFLKMDCEGCEYEVIRQLSWRTLGQIKEISMELHNGPQDLISILQQSGFEVRRRENGADYLIATRKDVNPSS